MPDPPIGHVDAPKPSREADCQGCEAPDLRGIVHRWLFEITDEWHAGWGRTNQQLIIVIRAACDEQPQRPGHSGELTLEWFT